MDARSLRDDVTVRANAVLGGLRHEYFLGTYRRAAENSRMTSIHARYENPARLREGIARAYCVKNGLSSVSFLSDFCGFVRRRKEESGYAR
jgi:hypothetical protein